MILSSREEASMASTWTKYLCLERGDSKRYRLFTGQYEPLGEIAEYYDEESEEYVIPESIDGKDVAGTDDDYIVGGDLSWHNEDETVEFNSLDEPSVAEWLKSQKWKPRSFAAELRAEITRLDSSQD